MLVKPRRRRHPEARSDVDIESEHFRLKLSKSRSIKRIRDQVPRGDLSVMPPSFQVNSYTIKLVKTDYGKIESQGYEVNGYKMNLQFNVDINLDLVKRVNRGWYEREPKMAELYIDYPSRCAVGAQFAVENDVKLKSQKWIEYRKALNKWDFKDRPFVLAEYWVEQTYKNMCQGEHVKQYVRKHAEAHPVKGITWNQILAYGWMDELFEFSKFIVGYWLENFYDEGDWCITSDSFNLGMRSRTPNNSRLDYIILLILERARQIGYATGVSSCNAFKKHDVTISIMRYIFDIYEELIGCRIISPKTEGGVVYTIIQEAYLEGKNIQHYDVRGMELITPTIINGGFNMKLGIGICVGWRDIIPELLSGVGPTSDFDIIAHLELLLKLIIKPPEVIVILGDDGTFIGGLLMNSVLYERQRMDDKLSRTLGLVCGEYIHPVAHNITVDTANKRINVQADELKKGFQVKNKMPIKQREEIADYFIGKVGNQELSEILPKLEPEAHIYSPREMIEYGLGFL